MPIPISAASCSPHLTGEVAAELPEGKAVGDVVDDDAVDDRRRKAREAYGPIWSAFTGQAVVASENILLLVP